MLYIGSDHNGFYVKKRLCAWFLTRKISYTDLGPYSVDKNDDYPDYAARVAKQIQKSPHKHRGILLCCSGVGMSIAANKFKNIRAALCTSAKMAKLSRTDDNSNILVLPACLLSYTILQKITSLWLKTRFSNANRHKRRIHKISKFE